jgi:hypothetical protein
MRPLLHTLQSCSARDRPLPDNPETAACVRKCGGILEGAAKPSQSTTRKFRFAAAFCVNESRSLELTLLFTAAFLLCLLLFLACFNLPAAQMCHLFLEIRSNKGAIVQLFARPLPDAGMQLCIILLHERVTLQVHIQSD